MDGLTVKYNELTADEFTEIWQSVWGDAPDSRQTALAMEHTLFRVSVLDGEIDPYLSALKSVKGLVSPLLTTGKATCKRTAKGTTLKLDATSGMIIKL